MTLRQIFSRNQIKDLEAKRMDYGRIVMVALLNMEITQFNTSNHSVDHIPTLRGLLVAYNRDNPP